MSDALRKMLAKVKAGDYVTAFGKATTGAEVTRTGVLLADPQDMKATHNGEKVAAIRVRVGEAGTDPAKRSTWTTLIPGHGSIRPAERPEDEHQGQDPQPGQYSADLEDGRALGLDYGEAHDLAESRAKSRAAAAGTSEPGEVEWRRVEARDMWHKVFLYGGKATKSAGGPGRAVHVRSVHVGFGDQTLEEVGPEEVGSGTVVVVPRHNAKIWVADVPEGWQPDEDEHQDQGDEEPEPEERSQPSSRSSKGVLFEGWLTGEQDAQGRWVVVDNGRRRPIGWLTADQTRFIQASN